MQERCTANYLDPHLALQPKAESIDDGRLAVKFAISPHEYLTDGRVQDLWRRLYEELIRKVALVTKGRDEHFIVKFFPIVEWVRDELHSFQVAADVMVAETANVIVPVFVWEQQNGFYKVVEWRCGHCQSVNIIEARSCEQCGAPRAKLIQEM